MWIYMYSLILFAVFASATTPCERLNKTYSGPQRNVRIDGEDYGVKVLASGGAARAEAALLIVILRYVLRYNVQLETKEVRFCDITSEKHSSVIIAPAAILNKSGCGPGNRSINAYTYFDAVSNTPLNLHLMAQTSEKCSTDLSWRSIQDQSFIKKCGFETANLNDTQIAYVTIFARNETRHDDDVLRAFEKRALAVKIFFKFHLFINDTSFRLHLHQMRHSNKAFVFIDEDLYSDVPNISHLGSPPCVSYDNVCNIDTFDGITSVRLGDGFIVKRFAPDIYETYSKFFPHINILRRILDYEASSKVEDIEEAACVWALDNNKTFSEMFGIRDSRSARPFVIELFLCKDDPYNVNYKRVAKIVSDHLNSLKYVKYHLFQISVNCSDENSLKWGINKLINKKSLAGAVVWSWDEGLSVASNSATYAEIPLMIAGPVSDTIANKAIYATSSRLSHLAQAYISFLSQCDWTRVAIISDNTQYSKDFLNEILNHGYLNYKNIIVSQNNISPRLEESKYDDARIFIINTNCTLADDIITKAKEIFSPDDKYVWIAREWCISGKGNKDGFTHYSIDFSWRGGKAFGGSKKLRDDLLNHPNVSIANSTIAPGISYIADAILQLGYGFIDYYLNNPSVHHDLRGTGTLRKFNKSLSALNISGVAQYMRMDSNSLNNPMIFIEKWIGNERRTTAIWQMVNNSIVKLWVHGNTIDTCHTLLDADRVEDSKKCLIASDDTFTARCYDLTILLVCVAFVIISIAIYFLASKFRSRYLAYNKAVVADILESRQKNASTLVDFLVNRESIKLHHEIGSGCYGRVYFAELNTPSHGTLVVAAKEPRENITTLEENEFLHEACVLARLEHSNVIKLMGVCLAKGPPLMLMEHAIYLDLIRYLTERRQMVIQAKRYMSPDNEYEKITEANMTTWACEAASALEYLSKRRFVHRDVRAANCLLDKNRSLKLADFGLARELDDKDTTYMTQRKAFFPVLWMAPECLEFGIFGLASDIWALGVLILEIAMMGARPYGDWPPYRVVKYVIHGGCPTFPPDASLPMRSLLQKCWYRDAERRITAQQIREYLEQNPNVISPTLLLPELPLLPPMDATSLR